MVSVLLLMVMMVVVMVIVKEATPESVVQSAKIHGAIYNARRVPNKVPDPSQTSHDQLEPRRQLTRSLCPTNIRRSGSNPQGPPCCTWGQHVPSGHVLSFCRLGNWISPCVLKLKLLLIIAFQLFLDQPNLVCAQIESLAFLNSGFRAREMPSFHFRASVSVSGSKTTFLNMLQIRFLQAIVKPLLAMNDCGNEVLF